MIEDNGIGRQKAAEMIRGRREKKSLGLQITQERLNLFNAKMQDKNFFLIEDITDEHGNAAGTRVLLKIRIKNTMQKVKV
jgi:hypothetical protein